MRHHRVSFHIRPSSSFTASQEIQTLDVVVVVAPVTPLFAAPSEAKSKESHGHRDAVNEFFVCIDCRINYLRSSGSLTIERAYINLDATK